MQQKCTFSPSPGLFHSNANRYKIVVNGSLDTNSPYAYMIFAKHFQKTCIVAEDSDKKILGFVKGYTPPTNPDALFVWQVGVAEEARGKQIAKRMIKELSSRLNGDGVNFIEATVTPSNTASRRLFRGLARDAETECVETPFFESSDFPPSADAHEGEDYFRVGPIKGSAFASAGGAQRGFHSTGRRSFIIRNFDDVEKSGNVQKAEKGSWESRRYLLRKDGMGFSFHHTILYAGKSTLIWYRNHVEAVMIVKGSGEIEIVNPDQKEGEGVVHKLEPWTMYALNGQERHFLRASPDEDMHVVCAFNPPIAGTEDHNSDGVYAAVDDEGNAKYELTGDDMLALTEPPHSLQNGTPPAKTDDE